MVKDIKNPVKIAKIVLQYTHHVMLVSKGVTDFGRLFGVETKHERPTLDSLAKYNIYKNNKKNHSKRVAQKLEFTIGQISLFGLSLWNRGRSRN